LEVVLNSDGLDGSRIDAAIIEAGFSWFDSRGLVKNDFDFGALGGPLGKKQPSGRQRGEGGENPNPSNASAVDCDDLAVVGF
jgi:hypothetical protein